MAQPVRWHNSLAWRFFLRTGLVILMLVGAVMAVAFVLGGQVARNSAKEGLLSAGKILEKSFAEQARVMDAGLEVFTQYSANQANIEKAVQTGDSASVRDTLLDNLSRLNADVAVVVRPTGMQFSCTTDAYKRDYTDVGIVQMAMHPEEAAQAGHKGPSYRGFFSIDGGAFKGVYQGVARRIVTPGGDVLGAMLVGTKLDAKTAGLLKTLALPKTDPPGQLGLLSHFQLLGDTFSDPARRGQLEQALASGPTFEKAKAMVRKGEVTDPVQLNLGGEEYLATLTPLRGANALDLEVSQLLLMPLDPFLAPFHKLQMAILGAGAGGLLLALLLALGSARSVSKPLARLTEATAALAEGQRPEIPTLRTQDEVGYLTQAFRALLSELKAKEELLAALDEVRADRGETKPVESRMGMTVVDMDATINIGTRNVGAPSAPPRTRRLTLKEGELFGGRYRIGGIVGKGGMGVVLKAHDEQLDEEVALKVIRPEHAVDESFLEQLKQEIKLARRITHKYVLRTHDFGDADGVPFVSMEYLKGVTLKQLLDDRGRLPMPLVLRIGRQVAEGLEAAHAEGVVHRDIKPLNVLFDARGDVKLMDFGLAAPVAASGTDKEGQVFGTPRYMAPEQVRGERVDPRTDLYALGVMLFELSSGSPPYDDADITHLMRMHLSAPVPRVDQSVAGLPSAFGYLLERLMAKKKEDRPSGSAEVVETLKLIAAGGASDTRRG